MIKFTIKDFGSAYHEAIPKICKYALTPKLKAIWEEGGFTLDEVDEHIKSDYPFVTIDENYSMHVECENINQILQFGFLLSEESRIRSLKYQGINDPGQDVPYMEEA